MTLDGSKGYTPGGSRGDINITLGSEVLAVILAKLENSTWGLAALKALIDDVEGKLDDPGHGLEAMMIAIGALGPLDLAALMADVGDASSSALGSLYGILGNPANSLATMIGDLLIRLTVARAAALDEITAARMAELDAGNIPADIDTLLGRLTAVRAGYLDELDFDLQGTLSTIAGYIDTEIATIIAYVDELETRLTAARAGYLDELGAANIPADIDSLKASRDRQLFCLDFWSNPQEEVSVSSVAGTKALPDVTIADLPAGATVVRAIAMFKLRMAENTNAAANKLDGGTVAGTSQVIQVRDDTPGTWRDAINFVDDQFGLAASTRDSGDVCIGSIDIAVEVDGNDTYNFQWLLAKSDQDNLNFNDVQVGLRIWYSV